MLYFDTSFLVPLVRPEASSPAISAFFRRVNPAGLAVSQWTAVEFFSVMAREVRTGAMTSDAAARANTRFEMLLAGSFVVILPDAADFDLASRYLKGFETALRAGDGLHLAIAANRGASAIYTLDKALVVAGKILRLPVSAGIKV